MPLQVYRLRRLLAATAVLLTLVVAGMYFYARWRATNVLKQIPGKIGYDIKQTASGFQFSKSDGKRTLFTVQASDVKEFKLNGNAELHNVSIVLYGRDSSRFDQIYGDDFAFNQKTGDVTAKGDVQIDLVSNPAGLASPDQTTPKELKNPIHLKTRDLVFNKDSGNAMTAARVEFQTPQATGWAMGVKYTGKSNTLTLSSQIHVVLNGPYAAVIQAEHGIITNAPREITLDHPHVSREDGALQADQAVFYLSRENQVERILATGNVTTETRMEGTKRSASSAKRNSAADKTAVQPQPSEMRSRADQAEFLLQGKQDLLRTATMTGNVHIEQTGPQPMQGEAGRVILDFAGQNQLQKVHALDGARLTQKTVAGTQPAAKANATGPQDFELTAPIIDFTVAQGHILQNAVTSGTAHITIAQTQGPASGSAQALAAQRTVVTAGKFDAQFTSFDGRNHLANVHGAPDARIVNSTPGEPDRVSTSDSVDATFLPQGGIDSITQQGNVAYTDGQDPDKRMQAWANSARYTPADQMLVLTGNPRVANGGMATTAKTIRINRATGDALAQDDVKSTYSELKEQPNGALLASSSPIHVTAHSMTAHNNPGVAVYTGNARLWQDANIIEAPTIQFDRDRRFVTAQGTPAEPVQTILAQAAKARAETTPQSEKTSGKRSSKGTSLSASTPISITAARLTYADSERRIHYEGGVIAKAADFTASAKTVDAYLLPRSQTSNTQSFAGPGQLDRMVAQDNVVIQQPKRRAEGQKLVYTAADDRFVLTGGPPSIFDAEQGKITGVSLTFFRRDDRVLVEGGASTPVVTQTRVAR
ncbi:MAG: LptA/OstA family protein [Candidatus Sulfotelmatobacter sp.]|jgi:lipopolysaccharide export system protein LptA